MFDDPKKELQRLQDQLLEEEEDELGDMLADAHRLLGDEEEADEPSPVRPVSRPARNRDRSDTDLDSYSRRVHDAPKKRGVAGLVFLLCLELMGIAILAAYWFLELM